MDSIAILKARILGTMSNGFHPIITGVAGGILD
jgi:hypothetical protein